MRDAIFEKLNRAMADAPSNEAAVAYTFVEIRKLLERDRKKDKFKGLTFFCDWVVHTELNRVGARDQLHKLDVRLGNLNTSNPDDVGPDREVFKFMVFDLLLDELKQFCQEMHLPNGWTSDPVVWQECVWFYGEIVRDCPLSVDRQGQQGQWIRKVVLTTTRQVSSGPETKSFKFDWEFELNNGTTFKQSVTKAYPVVPLRTQRAGPMLDEFGI